MMELLWLLLLVCTNCKTITNNTPSYLLDKLNTSGGSQHNCGQDTVRLEFSAKTTM